ncbi:MAG TPA: S8 family serine peptidase [Pyrinomonadaceae bacterium]|nr:S8 family serine peptidase [Pyrinomonadaceae bacterium]
MKKTGFALFCVVMLLVLTFPFDRARAQKDRRLQVKPVTREEDQFVPGRVLVKFRSNVGLDHARQIVAALGVREDGVLPATGVLVLNLPEQADEAGFANALAARPDVEFAELDRIVKPAEVTPNDPWFGSWQWYLTKIGAPTAWSTTTGDRSIVIAILDTGVDGTHPDLQSKMVPGWNVYNNNSDTSDVFGHGTVVAGTAAAASNNGQGVASIAWNCPIMPVRISALDGTATYTAMANGLTWAADHGARVANLSYKASTSATVKSAASYFQSKGGIVTSAAGNEAFFDASSDNPYILTIGATDANDVITAWSNMGNNVDLTAPGVVFTTCKGGTYGSTAGTSVSAPIVAGAAALVLSVKPSLSASQVEGVLKQAADDLGAIGWDPMYGWGRVNIARAISGASASSSADTVPPAVVFNNPTDGVGVSGSVPITILATDNVGVSSVTLSHDGVMTATDTSSPYTFTWTTTAVPNGTHTLTATAVDASGNSNVVSISVIVNNVLDITSPTIQIDSPIDGSKVTSNVSVKVNAVDNIAVTKVELYVDGMLQGVSTSAPFTTKWNTVKAAKGPHSLLCKAYDNAGNVGMSQLVSVIK